MADREKMSVAEMIAAARKADGGGSASETEASAPEESASEEKAAPVESSKPSSEKSTPAKSSSGGRLSVAEMMAMARGEKAGGGEKKTAAKPAAKKTAKPAAKAAKPAAAKAAEPRDTASILAAAKKSSKAGPMSKSEAAAKEKANPKPKPKIVVPPMPEKPAYAMAKSPVKAKDKPTAETRRGFLAIGMWGLGVTGLLWSAATLKFMFPNVLREPPSRFKVGFPDAFPAGQVNTKFKAKFGVWIINAEYNGQQQIYALRSVCTHLGCTPNWLEAEQKFKCPCHGSGFYKDGINFEGPAPRPLERFVIQVASDGQVEVDKSRMFFEEKGEWGDPSSYLPV